MVYNAEQETEKIGRYIRTAVTSDYLLHGRIGNPIRLFCRYKRRRYERLGLYSLFILNTVLDSYHFVTKLINRTCYKLLHKYRK